MTRLTLFPPPQVLFYLLFYIFFSMRYYINQRRATFYADTFESETKSMKHARLLFTSWDVSITEEKEMDDMKTSTTTASNLRVTATSLTASLTTRFPSTGRPWPTSSRSSTR